MNLSILPKLHEAVELANKGAKTRTLAHDEVTRMFSRHCVVACAHPGKTVRTTLLGGRVANSYKYPAQSTDAVIETSKSGDTYIIRVGRLNARKSPHGKGSCLYSTVNGRVIS